MYVNVAVLKEIAPRKRRVALVPSVVPKLLKLGAKLHMQTGAGDAIKLAGSAFKDVAFLADRGELVACADLILAVQPPPARRHRRDEGRRHPDLFRLCQSSAGERGEGKGYAGIVNALFYSRNCDMVYADAAAVLTKMIEAVRGLGLKAAA